MPRRTRNLKPNYANGNNKAANYLRGYINAVLNNETKTLEEYRELIKGKMKKV